MSKIRYLQNKSSKSSFDWSKKLSLSLLCTSLKRARSSSLCLKRIPLSRLRPLLWFSALSSLPGEHLTAGEGGILSNLQVTINQTPPSSPASNTPSRKPQTPSQSKGFRPNMAARNLLLTKFLGLINALPERQLISFQIQPKLRRFASKLKTHLVNEHWNNLQYQVMVETKVPPKSIWRRNC